MNHTREAQLLVNACGVAGWWEREPVWPWIDFLKHPYGNCGVGLFWKSGQDERDSLGIISSGRVLFVKG
jgi:hypothetical protein